MRGRRGGGGLRGHECVLMRGFDVGVAGLNRMGERGAIDTALPSSG